MNPWFWKILIWFFWFIYFWNHWCRWPFFLKKTNGQSMFECPSLTKKKKNFFFWVLNRVNNGSEKCPKTQNMISEPWWSWVLVDTWGVPIGTFRVPNGTFMCWLAYPMVDQLLTLFQRVFCVFKFFEEYFLHLCPWNTFLVNCNSWN